MCGEEEEDAFSQAKDPLQSSQVLVHYNINEPQVLSCDASSYLLGFVLSHLNETGQEVTVVFASRTLSQVDCNYSQMDREVLVVVA